LTLKLPVLLEDLIELFRQFAVVGGPFILSERTLIRLGCFPPQFLARNFAPIRREVREEFRDKDGYYVGHFIYGLVFGYNVKNLAANRIPSSRDSLAG
jgi:hypothetical protein